jgi:uncharacterized protein (DUF2147 family)
MRHSIFILAASAICAIGGVAAAQQPSAIGFWVTADHGAVVQIEPCASGLCGHLIGLRTDHQPGTSDLDTENPDPAKRTNPRCGLLLMGGLKPVEGKPGKWADGWVYDPESGSTYTGKMQLDGADTLKLRGYIGISLFGRTETWTRESGETKNRCVPPGKS